MRGKQDFIGWSVCRMDLEHQGKEHWSRSEVVNLMRDAWNSAILASHLAITNQAEGWPGSAYSPVPKALERIAWALLKLQESDTGERSRRMSERKRRRRGTGDGL